MTLFAAQHLGNIANSGIEGAGGTVVTPPPVVNPDDAVFPTITSPLDNATLTDGTMLFSFDKGNQVIDGTRLRIGDASDIDKYTQGGFNNYDSPYLNYTDNGTSVEVLITGLPQDGSEIITGFGYKHKSVWEPAVYLSNTAHTDTTVTINSNASATSTSVQVVWSLPVNGTGQVEWGYASDALNQSTVKETSFNYQGHTQSITSLAAETEIFYRVVGEYENSGGSYSSAVKSITTSEVSTPDPVAGWNDSMPNGGRAIGVTTTGITTGNATLVQHKHTRRFLATRSGSVIKFGHFNRVLMDSDIAWRSVNYADPIWKKIQNAVGNDAKRGGYMLGNSYSVGNGGLQEVTLQTDSGAPDHLPTGNVIATGVPFIPHSMLTERIIYIDFVQPGNVQAGQIYHLVYNNLNPPNTKLYNMSASEAQNAPIDKGAIALDGPSQGIAIDPDNRMGPFHRNVPAIYTKASASDSWRLSRVSGMQSLVYSDGKEAGETYVHLAGLSTYQYVIDGNKQLRQEFTWNYPDISVDRIVSRVAHTSNANGQSMSISIKNQSLSTVATASVPFDQELKNIRADSSFFAQQQTRHKVSNLSSTVLLETGKKYYMQYSAASGAGYVMSPAIDSIGSNDWNIWDNALCKQSTNGGNSWSGLNSFQSADLPAYFIPVGIPTNTPIS